MSNFYLDIIKDRLYCENEKSVKRRAAQTAMYRILSGVSRLIAPIMSFTAEEIWSYLPHSSADDKESIFLNQMPQKSGMSFSDEFVSKWELIYALRQDVNKALEIKRNDKVIGKSLEAGVMIFCGDAKDENGRSMYDIISSFADELAEIFIVSDVKVENSDGGEFTEGSIPGLKYTIQPAAGGKCERCWTYSETVGTISEHPTLCARCAEVIK